MHLHRRKLTLWGAASLLAVISEAGAGTVDAAVKVVGKVVGKEAKFLALGLAGLTVFLGWRFWARKVADGQQVNAAYEKVMAGTPAGRKRRPKGLKSVPRNGIVPASFEPRIARGKPDAKTREREIRVSATTDLIGYGNRVPEVRQKYVLFDERNQLVEEVVEKVKVVDGAGTYETEATFNAPAQTLEKRYTLKTSLLVEGQVAHENRFVIS